MIIPALAPISSLDEDVEAAKLEELGMWDSYWTAAVVEEFFLVLLWCTVLKAQYA